MDKIPHIYLTIRKERISSRHGVTCVLIAVSMGRQIRYLNTGVKIQVEQWRSGSVVNHPGQMTLNRILMDQVRSLYSFLEHAMGAESLPCEFSPQDLISAFKKHGFSAVGFVEFARQVSSEFQNSGHFSMALSITGTIKAIESAGIHVATFRDLSPGKLQEIDKKFTENGLKTNTRGIHFRNIRLVFNRGIKSGLVDRGAYPFVNFRIPKEATQKRNISAGSLAKLWRSELDPHLSPWRDLFMLSFFLLGTNMKDLLLMERSAIEDGRILFHRAKTGKPLSIRMFPEVEELLIRLQGSVKLLYFMERMAAGSGRKDPPYRDIIHRCNDALKKICPQLGIDAKVSSYYARHSWATIAAKIGIPKDIISLALSHSSGNVTDIYIEWNQNKIDQANRKVLNHLKIFKIEKPGS